MNCSVTICDHKVNAPRGMCSKHYQKWRHHGDPLAPHGNTRHGHSPRNRKRSPEYGVWAGMVKRCGNPKERAFKNYGARGITVYPEWRESFPSFYTYIGPRPSPKHTIERIDNNGNYEPGNVRWATRAEQNRNKRDNVLITVDSTTLCQADWAAMSGIRADTIRERVADGVPTKDAVTVKGRIERNKALSRS